MTIKPGDRMPSGQLAVMGTDGPESISTERLFAGKKVVLFCVPGAFTPTCSARHLPGYIELADQIRQKGVDTIACLSVNDVFVMAAWGESANAAGKILMLADGNGTYVQSLGLELDATKFGMGLRGKRFSAIIVDGVVEHLNVEPPGSFDVSSAENALAQLG